MSFIQDCKIELINRNLKNSNLNCLSFLYGLFLVTGEINIKTKQIEIFSSFSETFSVLNFCLKSLKHDEAELELDESDFLAEKYKFSLSIEASKQLLDEFVYKKDCKFNDDLVKNPSQKKDFLKAVFLACGTGNISLNNDESGYLLELVIKNESLAREIAALVSEEGFFPKTIDRKNQKVIYFNRFDAICDFFAYFGLNSAVLALNNENILREMRNNINRQNNCYEANVSKTINASLKQVEAIEFIDKTIGIENLSVELREICLLRLANKEESLENLVKLMDGKISKSGLNHRLNKIIKISENLKDNF